MNKFFIIHFVFLLCFVMQWAAICFAQNIIFLTIIISHTGSLVPQSYTPYQIYFDKFRYAWFHLQSMMNE